MRIKHAFNGLLAMMLIVALTACGGGGSAGGGGGGGGGGGNNPPPGTPELATLSVSGVTLSPTFQSSRLDYTAIAANLINSVTVTATTGSNGATITVNGVALGGSNTSDPIYLSVGDNTITVVVTASDNASQTYTITVTRQAPFPPSLNSLSLSGATLSPTFQSSLLNYTATVGNLTPSVTVTATTGSSGATIMVNGLALGGSNTSDPINLSVGDNTITVVVTAPDNTSQTYSVIVTKLKATELDSLSVSETNLDQIFQPSLLDYTATVGYLVQSVKVTAINSGGATILVDGQPLDSNNTSPSIPLTVVGGANPVINIVVTAGASSQTYTVTVTRQSEGDFAQQAYLKANNADTNDFLGQSVALSGDTLAVGAPGQDSNAGAVYVFIRNGSGWSQQAYLKASNAAANDQFGYSVALAGDTLVVGAIYEDGDAGSTAQTPNDNQSDAGAAYVFTRTGSSWTQQAYLKATNAGVDDYFGNSLAISESEDTLVVGAYGEDGDASSTVGAPNTNAAYAGAVYVFFNDGSGWNQQAYLKASNAEAADWFGFSVAVSGVSGDTLAVGAPGESGDAASTDVSPNNNAAGAGAAYVFTRSGTVWSQQAYLKASNALAGDDLGRSIALDVDTLVVGADGEDTNATNSGAAYVFFNNSGWSEQGFLKASNPGAGDYFGYSVTVTGDTLAVGASDEDGDASSTANSPNDLATDAGAAYVFTRSLGVWSQLYYVKAEYAADAGDNFGVSVSFSSGGTLAVGAYGEDGNAFSLETSPNNMKLDAGAADLFQ